MNKRAPRPFKVWCPGHKSLAVPGNTHREAAEEYARRMALGDIYNVSSLVRTRKPTYIFYTKKLDRRVYVRMLYSAQRKVDPAKLRRV